MLEGSTARNLEQEIQVGKSKVLEGHKQCINSVFARDNLIISGSYDKSIRIWNIESGTCIKKIECVSSAESVFSKDNVIISRLNDKTLHI